MKTAKKTTEYTVNFCGFSATVKRKNVKNINIRISPPNGNIVITAPFSVSEARIQAFCEKNVEWIRTASAKITAANEEKLKKQSDKAHIVIFGERLNIVYSITGKKQYAERKGDALYVFVKEQNSEKGFAFAESYAKDLLLELSTKTAEKWANIIGVEIGNISIRKMRTRYGSMNVKTGRMNLALMLYEKGPDLIESVIVHELCHLKEASHNKRFYQVLQYYMPDYKQREKRLKKEPFG